MQSIAFRVFSVGVTFDDKEAYYLDALAEEVGAERSLLVCCGVG
jgi:hypothetical protein